MTMLTASFDRAEEGAYDRMTQAWQWLCEQRTQAPDYTDVWDIRWQNLNTGERWLTDLTDRVLRGEYRLAPLQLQGTGEQRQAVWGAQDALVLKWAALSLQYLLPLHESCEHVKAHGGGKQSIEKLHSLLTTQSVDSEKKTAASTTLDAADIRHYKWVCRTDIRGYYRNINKQTLMQQVRQHVSAPVLRDLVQQYIHYTVEDGGTFHTPEKGISRGCPLSPLMGALHLFDMDEHFSNQPNIHYARYMDDVIILAKSRWSLRKHTKRLMQWFGEYGFEAHPDKTQIGRTAKGFDWMGAWLTHEGVTDVAPRAKANHREKVRRLYEQLARLPKWKRKSAAPQVHARVSAYRKRWNIWAGSLCNPPRTIGGLLIIGASTCAFSSHADIALTPLPISAGAIAGSPASGAGATDAVEITDSQWTVVGYAYGAATNKGGAKVWGVSTISNDKRIPVGSTIVQTTAARTCGIGVALVPGVRASGYKTNNAHRQNHQPVGGLITGDEYLSVSNNTNTRMYSYATVTAQAFYLANQTGSSPCAAGTVLGAACIVGYSYTTDTISNGYDWGNTTPTACTSGNEVTVTLGQAFVPPEIPVCTISVNPTSGAPQIDDVTPGAIMGTTTGSVLSLGTNVEITASCTKTTGNVNVETNGVYLTPNGTDFPSVAGFDSGTNTYVGLLAAGSAKATLGAVVTTADLWTKTALGPSPQTTRLTPIVIRGGTAPTVGSGNVVMTVSAVAP